jgi:hypothetical protein
VFNSFILFNQDEQDEAFYVVVPAAVVLPAGFSAG